MVRPNKNFELDVSDIELIEDSLILQLKSCNNSQTIDGIHQLLGRLHNQKMWYRPKKNYVGG